MLSTFLHNSWGGGAKLAGDMKQFLSLYIACNSSYIQRCFVFLQCTYVYALLCVVDTGRNFDW